MPINNFDPTEPTHNGFSAWEYAKLREAIKQPGAGVYGNNVEHYLRQIQLIAKLESGLEHFIKAGAFVPVGGQPQPPADPPKQPDDSLSDAAQGPAAKKARPKKRG